MTKILIHSCAPWCSTGYGQQTAQLALRLKADGYDVDVSAHFGLEGSTLKWNGITVWPGANDFGNRMLPRYIKLLEPDLVLTLLDVWVLRGKPLRAAAQLGSWIPIDHEPLGEPIAKYLRESRATPIAMSRHGERQLEERGLEPLYVPHAIDTTTFAPRDRDAARAGCNIPAGAFVVAMVATNMDQGPSRKGWVEALQAFRLFRDRHDDALLYLHTDLTGQHLGQGNGHNLAWLMEELGIRPEHIRVTDPFAYDLGLPAAELADIYNAADVYLSPSYGEGFGITAIEAQACGCPVILSHATAQTELCGSGWLVDGEPERINRYRAWWQRPSITAIVQALEEAHAKAGQMRDAAAAFAQTYDADRVYNDHWRPALEQLLPKPNRAARRRAERAKASA